MGKKKNVKTGRFEKAGAAQLREPSAEKIDEIIGRFARSVPLGTIEEPPASTPPISTVVIGARRRRWVLPVLLAVGVVAGGLMGAAAKDRELRPTIHLLNRAMDTVAARARQFEGAATAQSLELHALRDANTRLMLEHGGAIQAMDQARDTDRAASHDLRRARTALRYDQDVDRVSDRAKTWEALRAVEKAERRLNETP